MANPLGATIQLDVKVLSCLRSATVYSLYCCQAQLIRASPIAVQLRLWELHCQAVQMM